MNPFLSLCDNFSLCAYINTELPLPTNRETVLLFFESLQKGFPTMAHLYTRESGEIVMEEDKEQGSYRWVTLESRRVCTGYVNPPDLDLADRQHERVFELAPYHLNLSGLDCEAIDVLYIFDFVYHGNHDEVVAEALGAGTPLESFLNMRGARILNYEPAIMLALDESMKLQCRLAIETRTNAYQIRTGQFSDEPISVYFTVRQYWSGGSAQNFVESYRRQRTVIQELVEQHIVPEVLRPLAQTIAAKQ